MKKLLKNKWVWLMAIIALTAAIGGVIGYSINRASNSSQSSNTTKRAHKNTKKEVEYYSTDYGDRTTGPNMAIFNAFLKVKLGDVMNEGEGGTSYQKIKKTFNGGPSSNSSSETSGVSTEIGVWQYENAKVVFTFVDDHVVGSNLSEFRWKKDKNKITRSKYKKITSDSNLDDILKQFGYPDEISQLLILGDYKTKYTWFSGIKGPVGSNVSITFNNNKLIAKNQHGLT